MHLSVLQLSKRIVVVDLNQGKAEFRFMLKNGTTIISSTNFRNNIKIYLEQIDKDQEPVFLTVNGEGSHVIMHIDVYDELRRYRQYCLEHGIKI